MDGWADGRMDGWKDERKDGRMEGWKDGRMKVLPSPCLALPLHFFSLKAPATTCWAVRPDKAGGGAASASPLHVSSEIWQ